MSIMSLRHAPHTAALGLLLSLALTGCEQLTGSRLSGTDVAHHAGSAAPPLTTVPVPLVESGPAGAVAPEAGHSDPGLIHTRAARDKVAPGERAVWSVRVGETLRQTLGR